MIARNFIRFRTKRFQYEQPDDQLDKRIVGGDCADWFYVRLLSHPNLVGVTEPLMEDWGWYACIQTRDSGVSIQMLVYSWPYLDHCWVIGMESRHRLFRRHTTKVISIATACVSDAISQIIESDLQIESYGWSEEYPFESEVADE